MKELILEQKPVVFKRKNIVLKAYDGINEDTIIEVLNAFLLTKEYDQLTYSFRTGKQALAFGTILIEFKKSVKYLFKNENGVSKIVDIIFPKELEFGVSNYQIIKESHRVLILFYQDDKDEDLGYWTFIKGDKYEHP